LAARGHSDSPRCIPPTHPQPGKPFTFYGAAGDVPPCRPRGHGVAPSTRNRYPSPASAGDGYLFRGFLVLVLRKRNARPGTRTMIITYKWPYTFIDLPLDRDTQTCHLPTPHHQLPSAYDSGWTSPARGMLLDGCSTRGHSDSPRCIPPTHPHLLSCLSRSLRRRPSLTTVGPWCCAIHPKQIPIARVSG
jgi:hypothetical protein